MTHIFLRAETDAVYEEARAALDAAWGHVAPVTCFRPADAAPRDHEGRIVLAVHEEFTQYSVAVDLLPQLLESGQVVQITEAEYRAAVALPE